MIPRSFPRPSSPASRVRSAGKRSVPNAADPYPAKAASNAGARAKRLALAIVLVAGVWSCVGVDASLSIAADGSSALKLVLFVPHAVRALYQVHPDAPGIFVPSDEAAVASRAKASGATLRSFSSVAEFGGTRLSADLAFPSLASLQSFFDPSGSRLVARSGSPSVIVFTAGKGGSFDPSVISFFETVDPGLAVRVAIRVPGRIVDSGPVKPAPGASEVVFASSVSEILGSKSPVVWTIAW